MLSRFCQLRVSSASKLFSCSHSTLGGQFNQTPIVPKAFVSSSAAIEKSSKPDVLKRSPSSFMLFVKDVHNNKQVTVGTKGELGSATLKIAEMWKSLDAEKKSHYTELAGQLKKSRDKKIAKLSDEQLVQLKAEKVQSELKDLKSTGRRARLKEVHQIAETYGRPKRPTIMTMFIKTQSPRSPTQSVTEHIRAVGEKYRNLPEADKKKLTAEYQKACEKYDADLKVWEAKMKADGKLKELELFQQPKSIDHYLNDDKLKQLERKKKQNAKMQRLLRGVSPTVKKVAKKAKKTAAKRKVVKKKKTAGVSVQKLKKTE